MLDSVASTLFFDLFLSLSLSFTCSDCLGPFGFVVIGDPLFHVRCKFLSQYSVTDLYKPSPKFAGIFSAAGGK